jgi:tetratricopeptide (TPR) repeat protein
MRLTCFIPAGLILLASTANAKDLDLAQAQLQVQRLMRLSPAELTALQAPWLQAEGHPMASYWQALAEMGRAGIAPSPKEAEALLDAAEQRLSVRKDADSYGLRGALLGMRIGLHPMSAMSLSPKAQACFARARELEPGNPRVRLFEAIHTLHTPSFFGGGAKKALPLFQEAVACAERETPPSDPWMPAWGKAETLAWQAQALLQGDQREAAKAAVLRSLQLDPQWAFARAIRAQLP